MTDERERVTAYVDGALGAVERAEVEALLAERPDLREQVEAERELRERLRSLALPEPRPGFEAQVRSALRTERRPSSSRARWLVPLAAAILAAVWLRGVPGFVALEVARDHAKCFSLAGLPAEVWSEEPGDVAAWFEKQGTRMPLLPKGAANLTLVGARYCPLGDRSAAHIYYSGRKGRLSLFVVPGPLRIDKAYAAEVRGRNVRFLHSAGAIVALVSEDQETVEAFAHEFEQSLASLEAAPVSPAR